MPHPLDLRGEPREIVMPHNQPLTIPFSFTDPAAADPTATVDISGWTMLGQVRASITSSTVIASLTFAAGATNFEKVGTLAEADVELLTTGQEYLLLVYETAPVERRLVRITLKPSPDPR